MSAGRAAWWKPPLMSLGVLAVLSFTAHLIADWQYGISQICIQGPVVPLTELSNGTWRLDWPKWHGWKGNPVLIADQLPADYSFAGYAHSLQARGLPRDSARLVEYQPTDPEGWFEVRGEYPWGDPARWGGTRAASVEYRVVRVDLSSEWPAKLRVVGSRDDLLRRRSGDLDVANVVLTFLAVIGIGLWSGLRFLTRDRTSYA